MAVEAKQNEETSKDKDRDRKTLKVTVFAPRSPEPRTFRWSKHLTVVDAAGEAALAFEYAPGKPTLAKDGVALDREKQLVAVGVRDGDELELVDVGGGV